MNLNQSSEDLEERKLLGSGAYAFAKLIEQEELKLSLEFLKHFGKYDKVE